MVCGAVCFGLYSCAWSRLFGILVRGFFRDCGGVAVEMAPGLGMSCVWSVAFIEVFGVAAFRIDVGAAGLVCELCSGLMLPADRRRLFR